MTFREYRKEHNGITWDQYISEVVRRLEETAKLRDESAERALELAHAEMNRRLEGMNEIRSQLDRQAGTFPTKEQVEVLFRAVNERIDGLNKIALAAMATAIVSLLALVMTRIIIGN